MHLELERSETPETGAHLTTIMMNYTKLCKASLVSCDASLQMSDFTIMQSFSWIIPAGWSYCAEIIKNSFWLMGDERRCSGGVWLIWLYSLLTGYKHKHGNLLICIRFDVPLVLLLNREGRDIILLHRQCELKLICPLRGCVGTNPPRSMKDHKTESWGALLVDMKTE